MQRRTTRLLAPLAAVGLMVGVAACGSDKADDPKASDWLAERVKAPVVLLPFSVGGTPEAKDLFGLFDDTLRRLQAGLVDLPAHRVNKRRTYPLEKGFLVAVESRP